MTDFPYWPDDPLLDRTKHRMQMESEPVASCLAKRTLYIGTCSCGEMTPTEPWDNYAVSEAFDAHMYDVQVELHTAAAAAQQEARQAAKQKIVDDWNARVPVGTPVRYWTGEREGDGKTGRTRSAAYLLGASSDTPGHTPVVFVEGAGSCIGLTHVQEIGDEA
ncbi:hypothetical protein ACQP25_44685 (plasmid) [Microtetraspora malaysiensis]|uniref:hypothetical protein n=1 Tax=Microtetraspora malaysiensis TaxID=161358 RepID=UPI003D8B3B69